MAGLLFESFIALLLLITIGYCWKLSRRITLLHKSRQELNKFIQDFNTAIARAEHNIDELKTLGRQADISLSSHIEQAKYLVNDLSFLAEKGETVADNLEQQLEIARGMKPSHAATQPMPPKRASLPTVPRRAPAAAPTSTSAPAANGDAQTAVNPAINPARAKEIEQILTSGVLPPHMKQESKQESSALPPSKKEAMDTVLAQIALHKTAITRPAPAPATAPPSLAPMQLPAPAPAAPAPVVPAAPPSSTAARLNETIDRVFNKKRLEQVREQVEK